MITALIIAGWCLTGQFFYWLMWWGDAVYDRGCRPIRVSSIVVSIPFMIIMPLTALGAIVIWILCFVDNRVYNAVVFDVCKWWEERKSR